MGNPTEKKMVKKHLMAPFVNDGTEELASWVQIKKAVNNAKEMNPQTEERSYISDEHPTTEVLDYKASATYDLTMIHGEPDFNFFYGMWKKRAVGTDAHRELLQVNLFDSVTVTEPETGDKTYYYAYKTDSTIVINNMDAVASTLNVAIYENGTPTEGYVEIANGVPTFTAGEMPTGA